MLNQLRAQATKLLFCVSVLMMSAFAGNDTSPIPASCQQLLLVVTPFYESTQGLLYKFQREKNSSIWKKSGQPVAIVVGRSGLGWGEGLHPNISAPRPVKHEGDGCSPAGVFTMSTAFGFAPPEEMQDLQFPYMQITEGRECVDDTASQHYNALIDRQTLGASDWQSSERMFLIKREYRLGVFVDHNTKPRRAGYGSYIFLHIWSGPTKPTVGCTAMAGSEMEAIIKWLRGDAGPVLVQLPQEEYTALHEAWQLPAIE